MHSDAAISLTQNLDQFLGGQVSGACPAHGRVHTKWRLYEILRVGDVSNCVKGYLMELKGATRLGKPPLVLG